MGFDEDTTLWEAKSLETPPQTEPENNPQLEAQPYPPPLEAPQPPQPQHKHAKHHHRPHALSAAFIAVLLVSSLISAASLYSVYTLNTEVATLQNQLVSMQSTLSYNIGTNTVSASYSNTSLATLYTEVQDSVVTIDSTIITYYNTPWRQQAATESSAQGSGFIYEYNGEMVIITNNHVISDASSITVTFSDGNTYTATVLGTDASNDLAFLSTDAPQNQYQPLDIVSSSIISVGDSVVAIGSPYGLAGTMTTGIISAVDRTITVTEDTGDSYNISGLIQTSAPINSGNSGGPLMTYTGQVVGITTAIVSGSDGLGFAVSSNTILNVLQNTLE